MVTTLGLALAVPVAAWASSGPGEVAVEAVRRRPRFGFGVFGAICCLIVVAVVVLMLLMVMRGRRSGRR
jgi:hypothetical protein